MAKTFSLQPLMQLAKQRNDAATRKLGLLNLNHRSAQDKLAMLKQYRIDYIEKLNDLEKAGINPHELRNFLEFISRLDDAILHQANAVTQASTSVNQGISELNETQRKVKSYDTLEQRHIEAEKKKEAKAEQKIQDEFSGRRSAYHQGDVDDSY